MKKQESSLVNVKIDKQHWMLNSSSGIAVVCDELCPYMENITISSFFKAIEIHNNQIHHHILLNDIVIKNCSYGINVVDSNNLTNQFERNGSTSTLFRLRRIKVHGCHLAIGIFNQSYNAIRLQDIDITECNFGIVAQSFTADELPQQSVSENRTSIALFYIQGIHVYKCKTGIYLNTVSTTAFNLQHIDTVDCLYGIVLKKTEVNEVKMEAILLHAGIIGILIENFPTAMKQITFNCRGTTHVTSPIQVNVYSYYSGCRQVCIL